MYKQELEARLRAKEEARRLARRLDLQQQSDDMESMFEEELEARLRAKEAAQPGGSLYDKKGKLLYRGQMKNGLPHGYGTGYYANGKVGHVGMFKGGKIVQ
jgi:antitoxin component YwqK of YwqJK toxin-antitoxin module